MSLLEAGRLLHLGFLLEIVHHLFEALHAYLLVGDLPATEEDGDLDLGAVVEQLLDLTHLGCQVMIAYIWAEAHLAQRRVLLGLL